MKKYRFYTRAGEKVSEKELDNDAQAYIKAGDYADWLKKPIRIQYLNQHNAWVYFATTVYPE